MRGAQLILPSAEKFCASLAGYKFTLFFEYSLSDPEAFEYAKELFQTLRESSLLMIPHDLVPFPPVARRQAKWATWGRPKRASSRAHKCRHPLYYRQRGSDRRDITYRRPHIGRGQVSAISGRVSSSINRKQSVSVDK